MGSADREPQRHSLFLDTKLCCARVADGLRRAARRRSQATSDRCERPTPRATEVAIEPGSCRQTSAPMPEPPMTTPPEATVSLPATMPRREMKGGLKRNMVRGTMWTTAQRWSARLMGLATTMILARLLTPADFGVVAIALVIVGMVEIFSRTGFGAAIIRHPNPTREHYDSAWTFSL